MVWALTPHALKSFGPTIVEWPLTRRVMSRRARVCPLLRIANPYGVVVVKFFPSC